MQRIIALLVAFVANLTIHATELKVISCHDEPYSHIAFVCDQDSHYYVVKQVNNTDLNEQFLLVMDCLGSYIAEHIGIACNRVTIIPTYVEHIGKQWYHLPATLHTYAPGTMLSKTEGAFSDLDIQQRYRSIGSWVWKKKGPLPVKWKGLTSNVIRHMSRHKKLPALVAFDTFIGNNDRGTPNLFYDEHNDTFCGIDMGNAYKQNLCKEAVCQLLRLYHDNYQWSAAEIEALKVYTQTLKNLIELFPPKLLHTKLIEFAQLANLTDIKSKHCSLEECIAFYKYMITESYQDAIALVTLLELLLPSDDTMQSKQRFI